MTEPNCASFATILLHLCQYRHPAILLCGTIPQDQASLFLHTPSGDSQTREERNPGSSNCIPPLLSADPPDPSCPLSLVLVPHPTHRALTARQAFLDGVCDPQRHRIRATSPSAHLPATNFVTSAPVFRMEGRIGVPISQIRQYSPTSRRLWHRRAPRSHTHLSVWDTITAL